MGILVPEFGIFFFFFHSLKKETVCTVMYRDLPVRLRQIVSQTEAI